MPSVQTTRVSSKGQVVIPQAIRDQLELEPGEVLVVYGQGDTIVLKRVHLPDEAELQRLLEWGERFAEERGITPDQVEHAIQRAQDAN